MNLIILVGRLVRDPETRYTNSGMAVANFSVAVDRQKGRDQEGPSADFLRITAFGKTAELIEKYMRKGSRIGIEGRLQNNNYEKDGKTVYQNDIIANRIEFLSSKNETASGDSFTPQNAPGPLGSDLKDDGFDGPFQAEEKKAKGAKKQADSNDFPEGFASLDADDSTDVPF